VPDLSWLHASPVQKAQPSTSELVNQKLDEGASDNSHRLMSDLEGREVNYVAEHEAPRYEGSNMLLASKLPAGKRRFDDNTALASTGQAQGNRFVALDAMVDPILGKANQHSNSRREQGTRRHRQQTLRQQEQLPNANQNYHRRSMVLNGQRVSAGHKQAYSRALLTGNSNVNMLQESRKRPQKPMVGRGKVQRTNEDFPKDDSQNYYNEGSPNRRADSNDDDESENDDDDDDNEPRTQAQPTKRGKGQQLKRAANKHQNTRYRGTNNKRARLQNDQNDQDNEDIDATNVRGVASRDTAMLDANLSDKQSQLNGDNGSSLDGLSIEDETAASSAMQNMKHSSTDLQTAAGSHHGHHGHYYQYVEVPKKKAWKFGFKRGNHKHTSEYLPLMLN